MLAPGGNRHHSAEHWHLNWHFVLSRRAVAELSPAVSAPSTHRAVRPQGQAMPHAGGDGDDAIELMDESRRWPRLNGPVPELALGIETPRPDIAADIESETVIATLSRVDRHDIRKPLDRDRLLSRFGRAVP